MADYTAQIQSIYLAYYGRPADVPGLAYWNDALDEAGGDLTAIINAFGTSTEATALYSADTNLAKVNAIYLALFNRAGDTEGLLFYVALLNSGAKSQASIALDILNGAKGDDLTLIEKKLLVSDDFTAAMQTDSTAMLAYDGDTAATTARAMLSAVTADSDDSGVVETTLTTIETDATDTTTAAAQTFTLTTSDAGDATGDTGDDKFIALDDALTQYVVDGADGEDTLIATISETDTYSVSNVETITFKVTAIATIDMDDFSGEKSVTLKGSGDTTLENFDASVALTSERTGANDLTVTLDDASGSADSLALTLDDATATGEYVFADIETIELTSSGSENVINLDADSATTLDISGDADIDVTIVATTASLETIDASAATGAVTIDASAVALTLDVTTGSGDDTLEMGTELDAADVIDMGAGEDTLSVDGSGTIIAAESDITNVETLSVTSVGTDVLDASVVLFDNIDWDSTDATHNFTVSGLTTESITLTSSSGESADTITIDLDDATGESDSVTMTIESVDAETTFEIDNIATTDGGIETLSLVLSGDVSIDDISAEFATIEISGEAVAVIGEGTAITSTTIDASDATGDLTLLLGTADQEVTGGSGDDTFTFVGGLDIDDTIDGGDGEDTLTETIAISTTVAATISNVETIELDFANTASTFSGKNVTGATTLVLSGIETNRITNLDAEVSTIELTEEIGDEAVTIAYAVESDSDHTLLFTSGEASDYAAITLTRNAGALTIETDTAEGDFTVTSITAALASSLTVTTTDGDLVIDGADGIDMVAATSIEITTDGGAFDVSGAAATNDFTDATSITLNALDGDILVDGAAGTIFSAADGLEFNATADGEGNLIDVTILDVDFATDITLTATDGGVVDIGDIVIVGEDSESADIDVTLTLSATDAESSVTVGDFDTTAATTLDLVSMDSDAEGTISFVVDDTFLTITEIDASESLGSTTITLTNTAAAVTITLGEGTNDISTDAEFADDITLAAEGGTDTIDILADHAAIDEGDAITNFEAGADGDVISIDVSALTTAGVLASANNSALSAALAVIITDDADGDGVILGANTNILRITANQTDITDAIGGLDLTATSGANLDNDEGFLLLWTDGSDTYLSTVQVNGANGAAFNNGFNIVQLVGVDITDITAANFVFV